MLTDLAHRIDAPKGDLSAEHFVAAHRLVVNRGNYFSTSYFADEPALSDGDKFALIEFLKTF